MNANSLSSVNCAGVDSEDEASLQPKAVYSSECVSYIAVTCPLSMHIRLSTDIQLGCGKYAIDTIGNSSQ